MIGQRIFPDKYGHLRLPDGGYGRDLRGRWWIRPPGRDAVKVPLENLIEHADGTISILEGINGHASFMIERGVWKDETDNEEGDEP